MKIIHRFFICLFIISLFSLSKQKSFLDYAQDEILSEHDKEPSSLNPEYYNAKGRDEIGKCRTIYPANYERCSKFNTCNFCSANSGCGWCDEKKICMPINLNSRNDILIPLCQGDCIHMLKIEYCYKVLFEPQNNPGEINFSNYNQVINQDKKNCNKKQKVNLFPDDSLSYNPTITDDTSFESRRDNLSSVLSRNSPSLNYQRSRNLIRPLSVNLRDHHKDIQKKFESISKDVFNNLVEQRYPDHKVDTIPVDLSDTKINYKKYLKEFIPNFETPQYVPSDLENSIDQIKKEKLLLWLRGYSLNEGISKTHLPIYKNLTFINEDSVRKQELDNFFKTYVKDIPENKAFYKNVYKSLSDTYQRNISNINISRNATNYDILKENSIVNSFYIPKKDLIGLMKKSNMRFKEKKSSGRLTEYIHRLKNILNNL